MQEGCQVCLIEAMVALFHGKEMDGPSHCLPKVPAELGVRGNWTKQLKMQSLEKLPLTVCTGK